MGLHPAYMIPETPATIPGSSKRIHYQAPYRLKILVCRVKLFETLNLSLDLRRDLGKIHTT